MNTLSKILNLIETDAEIARDLFYFDYIPTDVSLWTGPDEAFAFTNIKWLFKTDVENMVLVGMNTLDDTIWAIDVEGDFSYVCDKIQHLPYAIIRDGLEYTLDGTFEEYCSRFSKRDIKSSLSRYEQWCAHNNIPLNERILTQP